MQTSKSSQAQKPIKQKKTDKMAEKKRQSLLKIENENNKRSGIAINGATEKKDAITTALEKNNLDYAFRLLINQIVINDSIIKKLCFLKNSSGQTALHVAAKNSRYDLMIQLIKNGAKINEVTTDGFTPLDEAIDLQDALGVFILLSHGAHFGSKGANDKKATSLHFSAEKGAPNCLAVLLTIATNSDINHKDGFSWTPLHVACDLANKEWKSKGCITNTTKQCIQLLLNHGANIDQKDQDGFTVLKAAIACSNQECIDLLLKNGAKNEDSNNKIAISVDNLNKNISGSGSLNVKFCKKKNQQQQKLAANDRCPLIIIIDDGRKQLCTNDSHLESMADTVCSNFAIALAQEAAAVIVAAPVLRNFFWRCNKINDLYKNAKSIKTLAHDQASIFSLIPVNDGGWEIYSSVDASFYLFLPNKLLESNKNIKTALNVTTGNRCTIKNLVQSDKSINNIPSKIVIKIETIASFLTPGSGYWDIYLQGHGESGDTIAGLSINQFKQLLVFLSETVCTSFLYYLTCFGGGINLVTPYFNKKEKGLIKNYPLNFICVSGATTELSAFTYYFFHDSLSPNDVKFTPYKLCPNTKNNDLACVRCSIDFNGFFSALKSTINPGNNNMPNAMMNKNQEKPWQNVLKFVVSRGCQETNTPLIRYLKSAFFQALPVDGGVQVLSKACTHEIGSCSCTSIQVKNTKALLVYPHSFMASINIEQSMPFVVSMNPEAIIHFFSKIMAYEFKLEDIIRGFLGDTEDITGTMPIKRFVIKYLECKNYKNSGLPSSSNVEGPIILKDIFIDRAPVSNIFFKLGDNKHYLAVAREGLLSLKFLSISKDCYDKIASSMLGHYAQSEIQMRNGLDLVAEWQAEPSMQAKKIADILQITPSKLKAKKGKRKKNTIDTTHSQMQEDRKKNKKGKNSSK